MTTEHLPFPDSGGFVQWFRAAAPYIHAFRGQTFVIAFAGEVVSEGCFVSLAHDLNLLNSLGVRLVLAPGARPQIEAALRARGAEIRYVSHLRLTDAAALTCVKEAVGRVRVEIEALLSMGLNHSPMAGADIRVASGNFVTAKPMGVVDGVDLQHTGEVRKIDEAAIKRRLAQNEIVLLSPIGYSPSGEVFNVTMEEVATSAAIALAADKLIFLMDAPGVLNDGGALRRELTLRDAKDSLKRERSAGDAGLFLSCAARACENGVARTHLIGRHTDGALLLELFTHGGIGTMVTENPLETLRQAEIDDIGGILALIEPLESAGVLVRRSRELLEMEIGRFTVLEHDGAIIGCAALYPFPQANAAELACLAVAPAHCGGGLGERLLRHVEARARAEGRRRLFVLTTRTAHWFLERGFGESGIDALPAARQALYNLQRCSKVFTKAL